MESKKESPGVSGKKLAAGAIAAHFKKSAGFGLIDIGIGLLVVSIVAGFALVKVNGIMPGIRANKAMYQTMAQLRHGREQAIALRRAVELSFIGDNQIQLLRVEEPNHNTTVLNTLSLENEFEFMTFDSVTDDTPDQFGNLSDVYFAGAEKLTFLSDGTLVNESGNPVNGTVFLGLADHPETARAVTVLGATGRVRSYRWTGSEWIQ
jgi:Tfp pilus assembly protein FimT